MTEVLKMVDKAQAGAFIEFMWEYISFLEGMANNEAQRLEALSAWDMANVDKQLALTQANAKQLENFEMKRIMRQQELEIGEYKLKELPDKMPAEFFNEISQIVQRFELAVSDIKFYNEKAMAVAKDNMMKFDPDFVVQHDKAPVAQNNPYGRQAGTGTGGVFDAKA